MTWMWMVLALLFAWALAEAFSWPVIPDAALAAAVFLVPELAWSAWVSVVLGTTVGGALAITLRRRGYGWPLPLVNRRMRTKVREWLARGPVGIVYQPLSFVPYKAFVAEAADRGLARSAVAAATLLFRGARMALVAAAAAGAGVLIVELGGAAVDEWRLAVLALGLIVFSVGWRLGWRSWTTPSFALHHEEAGTGP